MTKKVIIIGATSGIGRGLTKVFFEEGYSIGITGRRVELLESLKDELLGGKVGSENQEIFIQSMDLRDIDKSTAQLYDLIKAMDGMNLIILNSGVGHRHDRLNFEQEKETIDVNVTGFVALANLSFNYFTDQGLTHNDNTPLSNKPTELTHNDNTPLSHQPTGLIHNGGHIVGISSIAGIRGRDEAPAYNASKAFVSSYMAGLRHKSVKYNRGITITDIRPGFVQTAMASNPRAFWSAPVDKASRQIYRAIKKKKKVIYITKRWNLIALLIRITPDWIYNRI